MNHLPFHVGLILFLVVGFFVWEDVLRLIHTTVHLLGLPVLVGWLLFRVYQWFRSRTK